VIGTEERDSDVQRTREEITQKRAESCSETATRSDGDRIVADERRDGRGTSRTSEVWLLHDGHFDAVIAKGMAAVSAVGKGHGGGGAKGTGRLWKGCWVLAQDLLVDESSDAIKVDQGHQEGEELCESLPHEFAVQELEAVETGNVLLGVNETHVEQSLDQ